MGVRMVPLGLVVCVVVGFCCNIPHVIILKNRRQVFLIYKAIFFNICNSFLQI